MATLHTCMIGVDGGNFRPSHQKRKVFLATVDVARRQHMPPTVYLIFAPRVGFSTAIASYAERNSLHAMAPYLIRTKAIADGGLVHECGIGIAIFNADCPLVCLHDGQQLLVVHAGYRCLMRANRDEEGIIEKAIAYFPDPRQVKAKIFGGIGGCCWVPEYEDKPEIRDPELSRHPAILEKCIGQTQSQCPSGAGHVSVDVRQLAFMLLHRFGVPIERIEIDFQCTCCTQEDLFWSHTRYKAGRQPVDGRNIAVAWLA